MDLFGQTNEDVIHANSVGSESNGIHWVCDQLLIWQWNRTIREQHLHFEGETGGEGSHTDCANRH